jgi:hypothetical protein
MRKVALLAAASVAVVAATSPAWAINAEQGLSVAVTPSTAGTKAKPKNVKLKVTTTTKPAADQAAFATTQAVLYFDKGLTFGGSKFASCTVAKVQAAEKNCPKGSKVGTGSAKGAALGLIENLSVTAFNGPSGKTLLLHVVGSSPLSIDSVINAKLSKASGKYGTKLTVPIPDSLQAPITNPDGSKVYATLTEFITSVKGTAKGTPYVGLKSCSGGKLNFKGTFAYTDGTSKTATSTTSCK